MKVHVYRTYRWIDKDPIIDAVRTCVQETGLNASQVHDIAGISAATLKNWFGGETRKPQNVTVTAVTSALGFVRHDKLQADGTVAVGFDRARDLDWRDEMDKQARWIAKHGTAKQKKKARGRRKRKTNGHAR